MTTELFTKGYDSQNEDYCKVVELEGRTLVIMADGMGGLSLGAEAAECVCEGPNTFPRILKQTTFGKRLSSMLTKNSMN